MPKLPMPTVQCNIYTYAIKVNCTALWCNCNGVGVRIECSRL